MEKSLMSIGDVAKATGISVYTLRIWERRYGSPKAQKLPSGHRRYETSEVARLHLVKKALSLGARPGQIVALTKQELLSFLEARSLEQTNAANDSFLERWMRSLHEWNEEHLIGEFAAEWKALGPIGFLDHRLSPFLKGVGEAWARKEITVSQEHFCSEIVEAFLAKYWRVNNEMNAGRGFVVAAPSGESHSLGLHMCATTITTSGHRALFLGGDTPLTSIIESLKQSQAAGLCLGFSSHYSEAQAIKEVTELRDSVPEELPLIVGGESAPENLPNVLGFIKLKDFYDWLRLEFRGK